LPITHQRRTDREDDGKRQQRRTGLLGRVVQRLDQHERHEEHQRAEGAVEQERHQVQAGKAARPEQF
jgi:hypothetical protein